MSRSSSPNRAGSSSFASASAPVPRVEVICPFDLRSKFTKFHNVLLDVVMPELPPNAWKILSLVVRRTAGWGKDDEWLSYSQIKQGTGIKSDATVSANLAVLTRRNCPEHKRANALVRVIKPEVAEGTEAGNEYEAFRYHINPDHVIKAFFDVSVGMYRRHSPTSEIEVQPTSEIEVQPTSEIEVQPTSKIEANSRKSVKKGIEESARAAAADDGEPPWAAAVNADEVGDAVRRYEMTLREGVIYPQVLAALRFFKVDNPAREELALKLTERAAKVDGPGEWRKMVGRIYVCHRQARAAQSDQRIFNPTGFFVHKLREMDGDYLATYEERGAVRGHDFAAGAGALEFLNTLEKSFGAGSDKGGQLR
jgi:hypothetical protein